MDEIVLSGSEVGKQVSLMVQLALRQRLQNGHQALGNHYLLNWLMVALQAVWPNQGDLPYSPARWQMYAELQQVLQEVGIRKAIFSPENHGPDEEHSTTGMRNIVFQTAPTSLFGSLVAILSPHLGHLITEVTHTVGDLGEAEAMRTQKEIRSVTHKKNLKDP